MPGDLMKLKGKTAIVTGGTRGIGRGIANALMGSGSNLCISGRSREEVYRVVKEFEDLAEGRVRGTVADVRDYDQVKALLAFAVSEFGGVDILINNAGIGIFESVEEMSPENFRAILETNLCGVFYCCHEVIPHMKQRGGGYIINISSLAGANPHPRMAAYN